MGLAASPGPREMEWLLLAWSSSQRLNPASGFTESEVLKAKHLNSLIQIHQGDYSVHPDARDYCCNGTHQIPRLNCVQSGQRGGEKERELIFVHNLYCFSALKCILSLICTIKLQSSWYYAHFAEEKSFPVSHAAGNWQNRRAKPNTRPLLPVGGLVRFAPILPLQRSLLPFTNLQSLYCWNLSLTFQSYVHPENGSWEGTIFRLAEHEPFLVQALCHLGIGDLGYLG